MKRINYPNKSSWSELYKRPIFEKTDIEAIVKDILISVKNDGDKALYKYAAQFDGVKLPVLKVTPTEFETADKLVPKELKNAIQVASVNIEKFHKAQIEKEITVETTPGVTCWRKSIGIEKVGLYIPGGSAPLFSSVLMLGIPAKLAGCKHIVMCTPPDKDGTINPVILYTAKLLGITQLFKVGGAQAVAAMAYGTESIPSVYKIFGPGNQFVTKAKELIQQEGIAIDMPAGPSEVLVIADGSCNPEFVAADLLSQAEHGADSQVILLSDNERILDAVDKALQIQLQELPRKAIAEKAISNSLSILLSNMEECVAWSNAYAPEHLIIASEKADQYADGITNAGSVFLGNYSCESAGDYASGTNHTLPTNGFARSYSGLSVDSFVKKITFQKISELGISELGPTIELMATAEGLFAHKNAVSLRLKSLRDV